MRKRLLLAQYLISPQSISSSPLLSSLEFQNFVLYSLSCLSYYATLRSLVCDTHSKAIHSKLHIGCVVVINDVGVDDRHSVNARIRVCGPLLYEDLSYDSQLIARLPTKCF